MIAVVMRSCFFKVLAETELSEHGFSFRVSESHEVAEEIVVDSVAFEVVDASEDTFFGQSQAARKNTYLKAGR